MKKQNSNPGTDDFFKYNGVIIPDDIDKWIKQKQEYITFLTDLDEDFEDLSDSESEEQQFDFYQSLQDKLKTKFLRTIIPRDSFQFLGLEPTEDVSLIKDRFNQLAITMHPDKGGDREQFQELLKHKTKCVLYARRYDDGDNRYQSVPADISKIFSPK